MKPETTIFVTIRIIDIEIGHIYIASQISEILEKLSDGKDHTTRTKNRDTD